MWAASHVTIGAVIYESVEDEPRWLKWPLVVIGGFISHWLLDSVGVYHDLDELKWYNLLFILFNVIVIIGLWWLAARRYSSLLYKILPPHILAGLIAWFIWDLEWVMPSWWPNVHDYFVSRTWSGSRTDPESAILECLFMFVMMLLAAPKLLSQRKKLDSV